VLQWRRKVEGLVSPRADVVQMVEKGRSLSPRDTHQNFTPAAVGLSVTADAALRDNRKLSSATRREQGQAILTGIFVLISKMTP